MGAEAGLYIADHCILSTRHQIDADLYDLFRPDEFSDSGGSADVEASDPERDDVTNRRTVMFSAPGHVIRDRLDIMGLTLKVARKAFEDGMCRLREASRSECQPFQGYTFDKWRMLLKEYKALSQKVIDDKGLSELAQYFLYDDVDTCCGFPLVDRRLILRATVEEFDSESVVAYDFSDLVAHELYDPGKGCEDDAENVVPAEDLHCLPNRKLIVLTEGSSDAQVLRGSLELLYPHLVEFISFTDFSVSRAAGGASQLVSTLKAFAGTGVVNRVIAVFDNDTAAADALRALRDVRLPATVRWMQLPDLEIARRYPARSPSGNLEHVDVNGVATSIEMYFGESVLRQADGHLMPVHWSGYSNASQKYQGELSQKEVLQRLFMEKLERCLRDRSQCVAAEWKDMRAVIDKIRRAFN